MKKLEYIQSEKEEIIIIIFIILSTLLVYVKTLTYGYYFDDGFIFDNPSIYYFGNILNLIKHNRPFSKLIVLFISYIWELHPIAFHSFSVLFHMICGFMVYSLLKTISRLTPVGKKQIHHLIPAIGMMLFMLHPVQTESVVYTFQAVTVLPAAFFSLLGVITYIRFRKSKNKIYCLFLFLSCFLAGASRESAAVMPLSLWLAEWLLLNQGRIKNSFKQWPLIFICLIISVSTVLFFSSFANYKEAGMGFHYKGVTPLSYLITQFVVIMRYIILIFTLAGQNIDYDFPIYSSLLSLKPAISFIILSILLYLGVYFRKKRPSFSFGIFWFFLFLAPTSSVIPIRDVIFEHRLYLSLTGAIISLLSIDLPIENLKTIFSTKTILLFGYLVLGAIVASASFTRLEVWKNNFNLWQDAVLKSPNKARPNYTFGTILAKKGRLDEAIEYYKRALRLEPGYAKAYNNMGAALFIKGDNKGAAWHYREAIRLKPDFGDAYVNLGIILGTNGEIKGAIKLFEKGISLMPNNPDAHYNLGIALSLQGKLEEAEAQYKEVIRLRPDYAIKKIRIKEELRREGYLPFRK